MAAHHSLVGLGSPLLDISAEVTAEYMQRYGVLPNNAILAEEKHMPMYKELVDNYNCDFIAGGASQNTIRSCQWMSQTPGLTAFLGCIGNDENGQRLSQAAAKDGVTTYYKIDNATPTGTCAVLLHEKERSLIANLGAANNFDIDHLRANWSLLENARIAYTEGFFVVPATPSLVEVSRYMATNGKIFAMNLSAMFVIEFFKDQMMQLFENSEYVFGNEVEAEKFSQVHGFDTTNFETIALRMAALPKVFERTRTVVITRGKDPTVVAVGDQVYTFEVPRIEEEKIIDTNGAGDSFVGGFLSELLKGSELRRCVAAGNYCAGEVIQQSGCVFPPVPTFNYS
ncbi:unnamed protein product [Blepharisma stoltei]|uniref:Adenosine kinase n=1 Tax=Blepharisma stoltei TaxID=1481888 RepID=A0AAU9K1R9_9CILI|nr:unnamed protein product [Blepharisma stoltei]